ncbi:hypothetical protein [Flavobacterium sp.]
MEETISIEENKITYEKEKTSEAYLKEISIVVNCPCEDCHYFVNVITKLNLEIFRILKNACVDLEKNLDSEPTGVWCIKDNNDEFAFFQQAYLIKGRILNKDSFQYEKEELGLKINAEFLNKNTNDIIIDLQVASITK